MAGKLPSAAVTEDKSSCVGDGRTHGLTPRKTLVKSATQPAASIKQTEIKLECVQVTNRDILKLWIFNGN